MREFPLDQALDMARRLGVTSMTFKDVHVPRTDPPEATRAAREDRGGRHHDHGRRHHHRFPTIRRRSRRSSSTRRTPGFPLIFTDPDPARARHDRADGEDLRHQGARSTITVPRTKRWPRPQDAYAAVKSRDKRLGLCIDIGHTLRTGTDPVQACRECRDRLYDMHA